MKLKNSHVLLIVMSVFLLISIGSVCASDAAMDAGILANDSTDDIEPVVNSTPIPTTVESQDVIVNENDTKEIPVTVKDNESQAITITKEDLNVTENNKSLGFNYNNSIINITDALKAGNHTIFIKYLGNANYTNSSTNITLSIVGEKVFDVPSSVDVNSTKKVVIPIKLTDGVNVYGIDTNNLTVIVSYKDGNDTINKTISGYELVNGNLTYDYDLNVTTCDVNITYVDGNKTYSKKVTLKRIANAKIIPINLEAEYASGNFTFKLIDLDANETLSGKKLSYTIITGNINTGGSVTTDANGIATLDNSELTVYKFDNGTISTGGHISVGKQLFSIKGDDSSISAPEIKDNFTVVQATINIVIDPYREYYQSDKKVVINVTNAHTNAPMKGIILHLYMENTTQKDYYFQTDNNGTSQINVSGLITGTYPLTVSNNDTVNIKEESVSGYITIIPRPAKMTLSVPSTYYYNSGNIATVKVTDTLTGKAAANAIVLIQVYTGKKYQAYLYQANDNGVINVNYAPTSVGSHKITVSMADTRYNASSVSDTVTVKKVQAKISASKTTAYYKQGKYFTVKLTNTKNKKAIYGAKLVIKVFVSSNRYYSYTGTTGVDGKVNLKIDYKPGTYKVEISNGDKKNYTASSVTTKIIVKKAPAKLVTKKVTAKKGANKKFQVTVKNTKTKKVISGVKVKIKVYTGKSYKIYTKKTNSKGIAQLNVKSLKVGTHKVVVTSANKYVTAKTAKSSIKITKK